MKVWAIALVVMLAFVVRGEPFHGVADAARTRAANLIGAWTGHWSSEAPAGRGSAEVVIAEVPGREDVVGHFTFIVGGKARSVRYEGRVDDGRVSFPLVGDGHIVLEPVESRQLGTAEALRGEWNDARAALPAPHGVMELSRAR